MAGYAKLFSDIVDSSIWDEDPFTRVVWVTLLALSDQDGFVRGSPGWLAAKARVSLEQCISALEKFKAPDPSSRTADFEGRRVEQLEDGWLILNYVRFRDRLSSDSKAVRTRERVRRHRERYQALRNAQRVTSPVSASASGSVQDPEGGTGETEIPTLAEITAYGSQHSVTPETCRRFFDFHQGHNLWLNKFNRLIDWRHKLLVWRDEDRARPANGANGKSSSPVAMVIALRDQRAALERQIETHPANPSFAQRNFNPTDLERADLRSKRRQLKEIDERIAKQPI